MDEMTLYLANGDLLIRRKEGTYFISRENSDAPTAIEREEGERLLFDTANQLIKVVESLM